MTLHCSATNIVLGAKRVHGPTDNFALVVMELRSYFGSEPSGAIQE
jgi:hypothetical protein